MSAQNSAGIQTLLDAERDAQKIVQKGFPSSISSGPPRIQNTDGNVTAREYRTKRVKDARSEAQKEIEGYRRQKEKEFRDFEAEHTSGNQKAEEDADQETEVKIRQIKESGKEHGDRVVESLLKATIEVQPEVPERLKA